MIKNVSDMLLYKSQNRIRVLSRMAAVFKQVYSANAACYNLAKVKIVPEEISLLGLLCISFFYIHFKGMRTIIHYLVFSSSDLFL